MSELLLIPVPGSTPEGDPVLRVVVVPRLDARGSLAGTAMADWPAALREAKFDVQLGGEAITGLAPLHVADPDVWQAFVGRLRVDEAPAPGAVGPPPEVEPTSAHVTAIDTTYRTAAEVDIDPEAAEQPDLDDAVTTGLIDNWAPAGPEPVPPAGPDDFLEPIFDPLDLPPGEDPMEPPPGFFPPDFHQVLAMLREHPRVGRALGLVFELPVDAGRLAAAGSPGTVVVRWPGPPAGLPPVVPLTTAFELHERRGFLPASTDAINAGMVDVGDGASWGTATVDVDGAVGRLRDAAASVVPGETARLPALRSAGIALLRRDRAEEFTRRRAAARRGTAAGGPPLTADDLVLGLRVDVRFKGGDRWSSLVRREATYHVDDRRIGEAGDEEEGHVKPGAAIRHAGDLLRADEVVTRWAGWSLAVPNPRPGNRNGDGRRSDLPFDFRWDFEVPAGSLLPLRFGRDYHLRVRVADIAGGGVPVGDDDTSLGTPPIPYARYEPVGSPLLELAPELDAAKLGPGGTLEHLVVRSDAPDYPRNDARVLSAPHSTLDVAEQHGELDGADEATFAIVRRAFVEGHLPDPAAEGVTVFPRPDPGAPAARTLLLGWPGDWPEAGSRRLELQRRDPGTAGLAGGVLADAGGVIRVRLAPAEQLTLELSSFLKDGYLDQLALQQWRSSSAPTQFVKDGRHPMATPARQVTLVHAVRKPLGTPAGPIEVEREEGATDATLLPGPPLLGADPASTAELQITASWKEVDDAKVTQVTDAPVQIVPLERGQGELPPLRHELASTRHRRISYTLTAVSRFRHLFNDDEDPERFVARTTLGPIRVPNTTRPVAPRVVTVVPSFDWSQEEDLQGTLVVRHRRAGMLRVELARPWFTTGEGEHLGVVVAQTAPPPPELRALVSEVARDPVFRTGAPPRWLAEDVFRGMIGPTTPVAPAETTGTVVVAPYMVHPHENGWAVDVAMEGIEGDAYRPFVRLAVARYQPDSLPGLELSPIVRCPMVQMLPDRTVTYESTGGQLVVTLEGLGPRGGMSNRVDLLLESCVVPPGGSAAGVTATALAAPPAGMAAWTPVAGSLVSGKLGQPLAVDLPEEHGPLRVRVREVEQLQPVAGSSAGGPGELTERVVFTDVEPVT